MKEKIMEKIKDKKFKRNVLIGLVVFLAVILILNWLVKSGQASREKNQTDNFNDYYNNLLARCDESDKQLYNCCVSSVKYMAAGDFKLASELGCDLGLKINTLKCLGAYKWCEMKR